MKKSKIRIDIEAVKRAIAKAEGLQGKPDTLKAKEEILLSLTLLRQQLGLKIKEVSTLINLAESAAQNKMKKIAQDTEQEIKSVSEKIDQLSPTHHTVSVKQVPVLSFHVQKTTFMRVIPACLQPTHHFEKVLVQVKAYLATYESLILKKATLDKQLKSRIETERHSQEALKNFNREALRLLRETMKAKARAASEVTEAQQEAEIICNFALEGSEPQRRQFEALIDGKDLPFLTGLRNRLQNHKRDFLKVTQLKLKFDDPYANYRYFGMAIGAGVGLLVPAFILAVWYHQSEEFCPASLFFRAMELTVARWSLLTIPAGFLFGYGIGVKRNQNLRHDIQHVISEKYLGNLQTMEQRVNECIHACMSEQSVLRKRLRV